MNRWATLGAAGVITAGAMAALLSATPAQADEHDIVTWDDASYSTERLNVDDFVGTMEIRIGTGSEMTVEASGPADKMELLEVRTQGTTLEIEFDDGDDFSWTDWRTWGWDGGNVDLEDYPVVIVTLPEGSPVEIDDFTGEIDMGDTHGPADVRVAGAMSGRIGETATLDLSVSGAADIQVGNVAGHFDLSLAGAGDIEAADAGGVDISISGAGDVEIGSVTGPTDVSTAGAGSVTIAYVDGPVDLSIAGTGDIHIEDGTATEFDGRIAGIGNIWFGGTAVNPNTRVSGFGDIYIRAYEGRLSHSGMGDVEVGTDG